MGETQPNPGSQHPYCPLRTVSSKAQKYLALSSPWHLKSGTYWQEQRMEPERLERTLFPALSRSTPPRTSSRWNEPQLIIQLLESILDHFHRPRLQKIILYVNCIFRAWLLCRLESWHCRPPRSRLRCLSTWASRPWSPPVRWSFLFVESTSHSDDIPRIDWLSSLSRIPGVICNLWSYLKTASCYALKCVPNALKTSRI